MLTGIITIILLIGIDQFVKYLTVIHLKGQEPFVLLDGVFQLTYVENRGAAFGMLQNQRTFFLIFTLFVIGLIYFYYTKIPITKRYFLLRLTTQVFFAGAIGNWIDRLRLTYVVDMFHFSLIDFPVFNVADIYVVISSIAFILLMFFYYEENEFDFIRLKTKD